MRIVNEDRSMAGIGSYLKKHTETLVKDVGIEPACTLTGKSKATLGRYYSDNTEHADRFMPIDAVALLEEAAGYPHVTSALAELKGISLSYDERRPNDDRKGGVNSGPYSYCSRISAASARSAGVKSISSSTLTFCIS